MPNAAFTAADEVNGARSLHIESIPLSIFFLPHNPSRQSGSRFAGYALADHLEHDLAQFLGAQAARLGAP